MADFHFSGYATRNDITCSDGRVIRKDAFAHHDGTTVPLVWQHMHKGVDNVIGHAELFNREDGVYGHYYLNSTPQGQLAHELVKNGDVTKLSIYATKIKQRGTDVIHGNIVEVSLVLAGANPGAYIDNVYIEHADGSYSESETEAIIYPDCGFSHADEGEPVAEEAPKERNVGDVLDTLNDEQQKAVFFLLAQATGETPDSEAESQTTEDSDEVEHSAVDKETEEGDDVTHSRIFNNTEDSSEQTLAHSEIFAKALVEARNSGGSLKDAILAHAQDYGIENIDYLFPDAKTVGDVPSLISRRMEWVSAWISMTRHQPFSRIKTIHADITAQEARAKGYIKGKRKKEEVFKLLRRVTTATTIYKKQKLDRDDIIEITDLDVVSFMKSEMRLMLEEEIARAGLLGDGRQADDDDKINEDNIRPVWKEDSLYAIRKIVAKATTATEFEDAVIRSQMDRKGTGRPVLFCAPTFYYDLLLQRDKDGKRVYKTREELAAALQVSDIYEVEPMEGLTRDSAKNGKVDLMAILVNPTDYSYGATRGGQIANFQQFDIDFNQEKFLTETRTSGALTLPFAAVVFERKQQNSAVQDEDETSKVDGFSSKEDAGEAPGGPELPGA